MQELLTYLLKSSGLLIIFFAAYYFLLRKETFFTSNRWFLLSGLISSLVLPLFFIKKIVLVDAPKIAENNAFVPNVNQFTTKEIIQQTTEINWLEFGFYIYGIIAIILLFKIIFNLLSLYKILDKNKIIKQKDIQFIDTSESVSPFSFFNYIVINSSLYSESELQSILLHEKIHSAQKHSVDVLLTNLFSVVFWFNPFMHFYKKAVLQNLEFIADSEAIAQIDDRKSYQMALLKVVSNQNIYTELVEVPITNHFYQSLIKKRIVMLNKNQSHRKNSWKYAVIIPALIAFVIFFQVKVIAQEKTLKTDKVSDKLKINDSYVGIGLDSNDKDEAWYALKNEFTERGINITVFNIKRNNENKIIAINILMKSEDGREKKLDLNGTEPIKAVTIYSQKNENGIWEFGVNESKNIDDFETKVTPYTKIADSVKAVGVLYFTDKNATNEDMKQDSENLKKQGIDYNFSNVKRNSTGEIVAIKIQFDDRNGNKGTTEIKSDKPIEPIYFNSNKQFGKIGFTQAPDMTGYVVDEKLSKKFGTEIKVKITTAADFPVPPTPPKPIIDREFETKVDKNMLLIINGKEYFQKDLKGFNFKCDGSITHYFEDEAVKRYGEKAKDGVMIFNGTTKLEIISSTETNQERKEAELNAKQNSNLSKKEIEARFTERNKLIEERKKVLEERKSEREKEFDKRKEKLEERKKVVEEKREKLKEDRK